jgi:hypothetical protein
MPSQGGKDRAAVGVRIPLVFFVYTYQRFHADIQVFTPKAAALFVAAGVGLFFYFRYEKQQLLEQRRMCPHFSFFPRNKFTGKLINRERA